MRRVDGRSAAGSLVGPSQDSAKCGPGRIDTTVLICIKFAEGTVVEVIGVLFVNDGSCCALTGGAADANSVTPVVA